jgi:hypothetical protein
VHLVAQVTGPAFPHTRPRTVHGKKFGGLIVLKNRPYPSRRFKDPQAGPVLVVVTTSYFPLVAYAKDIWIAYTLVGSALAPLAP